MSKVNAVEGLVKLWAAALLEDVESGMNKIRQTVVAAEDVMIDKIVIALERLIEIRIDNAGTKQWIKHILEHESQHGCGDLTLESTAELQVVLTSAKNKLDHLRSKEKIAEELRLQRDALQKRVSHLEEALLKQQTLTEASRNRLLSIRDRGVLSSTKIDNANVKDDAPGERTQSALSVRQLNQAVGQDQQLSRSVEKKVQATQ